MPSGIKLNHEYVKDYIDKSGCVLLSNNYHNSKSKLDILFKCGHCIKMSFQCFMRGHECPCSSINKFKLTVENKTRDKIMKALSSVNFDLVEFENDICSWDNNITYICNNGHKETRVIRNFMCSCRCVTCYKPVKAELQKGSKGSNWRGGKTEISVYVKNKLIKEWKKASMLNCNYNCVLTGERFDDIHHLYPLHRIIEECFSNLGIPILYEVCRFSEDQLEKFTQEIKRLHEHYPLGVCLTKEAHRLFHKLYGNKNTTPEDFYDFINRYSEIQFRSNNGD